jgi:hypothetical protein
MTTLEGQQNLMKFSLSLVRSTGGNYERVPKIVGRILDLDRLQNIAKSLLDSEGEGSAIAARFVQGLKRSENSPFGDY